MSRKNTALIALISTCIWVFVGAFLPFEGFKKVFFDLSQDSFFLYPFTIQNMMWLAFFVGLGELYYRHLQAQKMTQSLRDDILDIASTRLINSDNTTATYQTLKQHDGALATLLMSLLHRFQASFSVEQTNEMLNSQLEFLQYRLDLAYNYIRYLSWLIPTLGFIGTVVGIAYALLSVAAADPNGADFLAQLVGKLAVAFNTTLVALIMSAILVFLTHLIQNKEEEAIADCGEYCLNGFILKLYIGKE